MGLGVTTFSPSRATLTESFKIHEMKLMASDESYDDATDSSHALEHMAINLASPERSTTSIRMKGEGERLLQCGSLERCRSGIMDLSCQ